MAGLMARRAVFVVGRLSLIVLFAVTVLVFAGQPGDPPDFFDSFRWSSWHAGLIAAVIVIALAGWLIARSPFAGRYLLGALAIALMFAGQLGLLVPPVWRPIAALAAGAALAAYGLRCCERQEARLELSNGFTLVMLGGVLVLSSYLRFVQLNDYGSGYVNDEAHNTAIALDWLTGKPFDGLNGQEFLFNYLGGQWMKLFGPTTVALRGQAALYGTATVVCLFFFARQWFGNTTALFATFFLAVSPWHIAASRTAERLSQAILFVALAYALGSWAFRRLSWSAFALAGLVTGIGMHTWFTFKVIPAVFAAWTSYALFTKRQDWRRLLLSVLLGTAAMAIGAFGLYFFLRQDFRSFCYYTIAGELRPGHAAADSGQYWTNLKLILTSLATNITNDNFYLSLPSPTTPLVLSLATAGLAAVLASRGTPRFLLPLMLAAHAAPAVFSSFPFQRRLQGLMIPLFLLAAVALSAWIRTAVLSRRQLTLEFVILLAALGAADIPRALHSIASRGSEIQPFHLRIREMAPSHAIFYGNSPLPNQWIESNSYEFHRTRWSFWWGDLKKSLPLLIDDRRDAALYFPAEQAPAVLSRLTRLYPHCRITTYRETNGVDYTVEALVPRTDLAAARTAWLDGADWQPGLPVGYHGARFLPLDVQAVAQPWATLYL